MLFKHCKQWLVLILKLIEAIIDETLFELLQEKRGRIVQEK